MGLYLSGFGGVSASEVLSSKFRGAPYSEFSYGMYLNECSGYHVENNEFFENTLGSPITIGLIVNNSGTSPNEIYRNTFHKLKYATLSQNENRNAEDTLGGLCYKCNKFVKDVTLTEPNEQDIVITHEGQDHTSNTGIAKYQGTHLIGYNYAAAGNMFKPYPDPDVNHLDFFNHGNAIEYFFHFFNQLPYRLRPDYNFGPIITNLVPAQFDENSCPSKLERGLPDEEVILLMESENQSDSIGDVLNSLVDGGSTTLLNLEVITSSPPEALQTRNELIAESPYLSDTVMKTSITKEDVLDNAMIRDVLVANPHSAKSDEIINLLENRAIPMPDYMMEQILAGEDTVSAKEILEAQKAWWEGEASTSYIRLLDYYKGDSIRPANEDSINWLFSYYNTLDAQYDKVCWLHANGEYTQAYNILATIPESFNLSPSQLETHNAYTDFYELNQQINSDTSGVFTIDSTIISSLQVIANTNTGKPGAFARNILIANGIINYQEPIILPDTSLKSGKNKKFKGVKESGVGSMLTVYPNPAHDYFVVKIKLEKILEKVMINLYDENGRIVYSRAFKGKEDQITIPTLNLTSGIYILTIEAEGKHLDKSTIAIVQ